MRSFVVLVAACAAALSSISGAAYAAAEESPSTRKINAYVACINRLSERAYDSRSRYFSWASKKGPTGKERIIYGTYTIYETDDCAKGVERANALEPHEAELEADAASYVAAVVTLEPLLKEADDYYSQENYKDDGMAKGKALHPRLVAAWDAFEKADRSLRSGLDRIQDAKAEQRLLEIERTFGHNGRYHVEVLMQRAKRVLRAEGAEAPKLPEITATLTAYEAAVTAAEAYATTNSSEIGSGYISSAKSFLVTAKQLMRRLRDKVPYSQGDRMMMSGGGGWMVEGSPARLSRDYNALVDSYNRAGRF